MGQIIPAYKYEIYDVDDRLLNINYESELAYKKEYKNGRYEKVTPVAFELMNGAEFQNGMIVFFSGDNHSELTLNSALDEYHIEIATGNAKHSAADLPVQIFSNTDAVLISPQNIKCEIVRIMDANQVVAIESFARTIHLTIVETYPDHEPRKDSPYKKFFDATRRKMKKEGRLKCWICGVDDSDENIAVELHHNIIEESLANGVDLNKFMEKYPESGVSDEDTLMQWKEEEENMLPLCTYHHRGAGGIHSILYPQWIAQRFWKAEVEVPAKYVKAMGLGEVVFVRETLSD